MGFRERKTGRRCMLVVSGPDTRNARCSTLADVERITGPLHGAYRAYLTKGLEIGSSVLIGRYRIVNVALEDKPAPHGRRCAFGACEKDAEALGLCWGHYQQRRAGKPLRALRVYSPVRRVTLSLRVPAEVKDAVLADPEGARAVLEDFARTKRGADRERKSSKAGGQRWGRATLPRWPRDRS